MEYTQRMRVQRPYQELPDAADKKNRLIDRLADFKIAIFLDYDGTLTPIMAHPEEALLADGMRRALAVCAGKATVAIVSGRDKNNIQDLVNLPQIIYAGNHGFDIEGVGEMPIRYQAGVDFIPVLWQFFEEIQAVLCGISGVRIEFKKLSVAVHYRNVGEDSEQRVIGLTQKMVGQYATLSIIAGKKVLEIRPNIDWNKGRAVEWIVEKLNLKQPDICIIYIGDDITDEDAFRTLSDPSVGILVGHHAEKTYAHYRLENPFQVQVFIENLSKRITR